MPARPQSRSKLIACLLCLPALALAIGNIVLTSQLSSRGEDLKKLEQTSQALRHQNQLLEQQLVVGRSLTELQQQATTLGYTEKPQTIIITPDAPVAQVVDAR